jgi:hypothetical protein
MKTTPYSTAADTAFWSRAVSRRFDAADLISSGDRLLQREDRVMTAGSCFAANIIPYLERAGITHVRTEQRHPLLNAPPEALGYDSFSAAYGNVYTARQLLQLLQRALGVFQPEDAVWEEDGRFVDPYRPGLKYKARSPAEFEALTARHLAAVRRAFEQATVFVFTLGLTEAWVSGADGAVYPACPGTVAGAFDAGRHSFRNFTSADVRGDLDAFIALVRTVNPALKIILTVSPVPLVATATSGHVLSATVYSKSVLRVAAGETAEAHRDVVYFPAYEIVTGPQAPYEYFDASRRNVTPAAIDAVMTAFLAHCDVAHEAPEDRVRVLRPAAQAVSQMLSAAQCEEEMLDPQSTELDQSDDAGEKAGGSKARRFLRSIFSR